MNIVDENARDISSDTHDIAEGKIQRNQYQKPEIRTGSRTSWRQFRRNQSSLRRGLGHAFERAYLSQSPCYRMFHTRPMSK